MNNEFAGWNKKLNQIGEIILEKERECLESLGRGLAPNNCDERYTDQYFKEVGYNLWAGYEKNGLKVEYPHFKDYGGADGGELKDGKFPAKMKSIRSSSAMTYNLLGNESIKLLKGTERLSEGTYQVEYEKKLYTLKGSPHPANLDAYLYKDDSKEAIFCEMKMMEWILNEPGILKDAYSDGENYYSSAAEDAKTTKAFLEAIKLLKAEMLTDKETFYRYDAWQMFKHTLGIYNMTSDITKEDLPRSVEPLPELQKVTLVNVVFEPSEELFIGELKEFYQQFRLLEHENFKQFKKAMVESGVVEAFSRDCNIDFDVQYMSVSQFMDCFDLGDRQSFLERYRLDK